MDAAFDNLVSSLRSRTQYPDVSEPDFLSHLTLINQITAPCVDDVHEAASLTQQYHELTMEYLTSHSSVLSLQTQLNVIERYQLDLEHKMVNPLLDLDYIEAQLAEESLTNPESKEKVKECLEEEKRRRKELQESVESLKNSLDFQRQEHESKSNEMAKLDELCTNFISFFETQAPLLPIFGSDFDVKFVMEKELKQMPQPLATLYLRLKTKSNLSIKIDESPKIRLTGQELFVIFPKSLYVLHGDLTICFSWFLELNVVGFTIIGARNMPFGYNSSDVNKVVDPLSTVIGSLMMVDEDCDHVTVKSNTETIKLPSSLSFCFPKWLAFYAGLSLQPKESQSLSEFIQSKIDESIKLNSFFSDLIKFKQDLKKPNPEYPRLLSNDQYRCGEGKVKFQWEFGYRNGVGLLLHFEVSLVDASFKICSCHLRNSEPMKAVVPKFDNVEVVKPNIDCKILNSQTEILNSLIDIQIRKTGSIFDVLNLCIEYLLKLSRKEYVSASDRALKIYK
ncbi:hypothetical protein P9112_005993 [Eukaryota sp. TZLM1-RC]